MCQGTCQGPKRSTINQVETLFGAYRQGKADSLSGTEAGRVNQGTSEAEKVQTGRVGSEKHFKGLVSGAESEQVIQKSRQRA